MRKIAPAGPTLLMAGANTGTGSREWIMEREYGDGNGGGRAEKRPAGDLDAGSPARLYCSPVRSLR